MKVIPVLWSRCVGGKYAGSYIFFRGLTIICQEDFKLAEIKNVRISCATYAFILWATNKLPV